MHNYNFYAFPAGTSYKKCREILFTFPQQWGIGIPNRVVWHYAKARQAHLVSESHVWLIRHSRNDVRVGMKFFSYEILDDGTLYYKHYRSAALTETELFQWFQKDGQKSNLGIHRIRQFLMDTRSFMDHSGLVSLFKALKWGYDPYWGWPL